MHFVLDKITQHEGKDIAYIHLLDGDGSIIETKSMDFVDTDDLKSKIQEKFAKVTQKHKEKKDKINKINKVLSEITVGG